VGDRPVDHAGPVTDDYLGCCQEQEGARGLLDLARHLSAGVPGRGLPVGQALVA